MNTPESANLMPDFTEHTLHYLHPDHPDVYHLETFIADGIQMSASDLFVSSRESHVALAVRRMGLVKQCGMLPRDAGLRLIGHVKAAAGMDLTRAIMPQDGRLTVEIGDNRRIDVRLSIIPTLFGEDLTMRLLDRNKQDIGVESIGFHPGNLKNLIALLSKPGGLILVTGPVDMGKTTSLYACIKHLNDGTKKIHTIEDPIEYTLDGIHQSQTNLRRGVDFPELLRGILRQSPDVILVGEVRDTSTAEIVVRAANSGQLVFATAHASTSAGACQNLIVLGVKPHFLATSLLGVVTQRLIRKLCPFCKVPLDPFHWEGDFPLENNDDGEKKAIYTPIGCPECHGTGYIGRTAVGEVLRTTPEIRRLIQQGGTSSQVHQLAMSQGMIDLRTDAQHKVDMGITSPDEIMRVVPSAYSGLESE